METYDIRFKPSVEKDLRRLPKSVVERAVARIEDLQTNPLPRQAVKLSESERMYRLRVGEYRVIYEVDTQARKITVHYVRHRGDVYRSI